MEQKIHSEQKITPFLWFHEHAEEAVNFYVQVFASAKILSLSRYGKNMPGPEGSVMAISFQLEGQQFVALNGGPLFDFNQAISFVVNCDSQEEIDHYWEKLSEGGKTNQCGWLQDRFGVPWQIVPRKLGSMMSTADAARNQRVMEAMLSMQKFDMQLLEAAYTLPA